MFHFNSNTLEMQISQIIYRENILHPFRYRIRVLHASNSQDMEIRDWLGETFNDNDYSIRGFEIRFMHEKHAQWFIMRWNR